MKFKVNSYHFNLLRDYERLSVFKEAIDDFSKEMSLECSDNLEASNLKVAYDLGAGSGVLTYFAKDYFDKIYSVEMSPSIISSTRENLELFDNVEVFNQNVLDLDFEELEKADLIICEMLDTALIDEEEVPVLNHARKFLKENGRIIPQSVINAVELVYLNNHFIQYEDNESSPIYEILTEDKIYSEFDFREFIEEEFSTVIEFEINGDFFKKEAVLEKSDCFNKDENKIKINGLRLSSYTKLNENIICGPTPMLNPVMLVPIEEFEADIGEKIKIKLEYVMGGGVETIKTELIR
ncbi:methyltransferase domain-containing protein [uncultured Methanobrevibacter sp.]|uniref:methyltransferase domain-containing protein n=1 Tax=uncultured Methanobrevibacter sp. TaxID=253161 RepID=UPI00260FD5CF